MSFIGHHEWCSRQRVDREVTTRFMRVYSLVGGKLRTALAGETLLTRDSISDAGLHLNNFHRPRPGGAFRLLPRVTLQNSDQKQIFRLPLVMGPVKPAS